MGKICYMIVVCLMVLEVTFCGEGSKCNPNNPPTLKNVTLDMIAGRWYVQKIDPHFPNQGVPSSQFLSEFSLDFSSVGTMVMNGRTAYEPQACLYNTVDIEPTGEQSTWSGFAGYLSKDLDVRVLDTDYKNYMLIWLCFRHDENTPELCTDYIVDLFTKSAVDTLLESTYKVINQAKNETVCSDHWIPRPADPKKARKSVSASASVITSIQEIELCRNKLLQNTHVNLLHQQFVYHQ